jgi:putative endonuclease
LEVQDAYRPDDRRVQAARQRGHLLYPQLGRKAAYMTNQKKTLGQWGEGVATLFLESKGYTICARNFRTSHGEIDIVASKESALFFIEVKTRSSHTFAYPEDSVTLRKQAHMLSAAEEYLQEYPESGDNWQFDVIAIERKPGGKMEIVHFENVIG